MSTRVLQPLPDLDRIENGEPESIEDAEAERRRLIIIVQHLQAQMTEHGRNVGDFHEWRTRAKAKLRIATKRLTFINAWIKQVNRDTALMNTTLASGDDLDDPVVLVARLRKIVIRLRALTGPVLTEEEQKVINVATDYVQTMARERVLTDERKRR